MANFIGTARTNYFRVADEARYTELVANLTSEDGVKLWIEERDGVTYHGFGAYDSIDYVSKRDKYGNAEEWDFDAFLAELQKILPEDEAFMYFMTGHEKLRYVEGLAVVCTRDEVVYCDLDSWAKKQAKMILGEGFETETGF